MTIIKILAFIALIAIIFGVSMHEAFWGIIIFILGVVLFTVAVLMLGYGLLVAKDKAKRLLRPTEQEKAQRKKSLSSDIDGAILVIWLFSPWVLIIILGTVFKDYTENNGWITYIAFAPYVIPIVAYIILKIKIKIKTHKAKKRIKKA